MEFKLYFFVIPTFCLIHFRVFNIFKEFCLWKTIEIPIRKKPLKIADYIYSTKVVKGAFGYIDLLIFIPYINIHLITINV